MLDRRPRPIWLVDFAGSCGESSHQSLRDSNVVVYVPKNEGEEDNIELGVSTPRTRHGICGEWARTPCRLLPSASVTHPSAPPGCQGTLALDVARRGGVHPARDAGCVAHGHGSTRMAVMTTKRKRRYCDLVILGLD